MYQISHQCVNAAAVVNISFSEWAIGGYNENKWMQRNENQTNTSALEMNVFFITPQRWRKKTTKETIEFEMHWCMCVVAFLPAGKISHKMGCEKESKIQKQKK